MSTVAKTLQMLDAAEHGLLGIGIPKCPASALLAASLRAIDQSRPEVRVESLVLGSAEDWAARESELWPRGIRASRASAPALFLLRHGQAIATRPGAAPAHVLDDWIAERLGPAAVSLPKDLTDAERKVLEETSARRAQHAEVKGSRTLGP